MKALEELDERIRELLINNNWDISISDYPDIVQDAKALGLDERQLNHKVMQLDSQIDKRPYNLLDSLIEEPVSKGIIQDQDVQHAISQIGDKIPASRATSYIIYKIRRHHFEPRNRVPLDWNSFRNPWMTNDAWKKYQETHLEVEWLGEKARTLEELGEISFRKKEDAQYYFRNSNYLPPLVTVLSKNAARADNFARIIDTEPDTEARYLTIVYRLNPTLPFRFHGKTYQSVTDLLNDAVQSPESFWALAQTYRNRHIHIWLRESNATAAGHLTEERDTNGFLTFLYRMDNRYPFYLKQLRFDTPESLVAEAKKNAALWPEMVTIIENGNLRSWLDGLGRQDHIMQFESALSPVMQSDLYSAEDKKLASVQTLITVIDPVSGFPAVEAVPPSLTGILVEASKTVYVGVRIRLINEGFVKVRVFFNEPLEGITIDKKQLSFYSQAGQQEQSVQLSIDPMKLVKNKRYQFNILLGSVYATREIPVELKVVFPKKAFFIQLLKYAAFGAVFFGGIGIFLQMIASSLPFSADEEYFSFDAGESPLSLGYYFYIVPVFLLLAGLIFSISLIRKVEKI